MCGSDINCKVCPHRWELESLAKIGSLREYKVRKEVGLRPSLEEPSHLMPEQVEPLGKPRRNQRGRRKSRLAFLTKGRT